MKKRDVSDAPIFSNEKYPEAGGYVCGIYEVVEKEEYGLFEVSVDIIEGEFKGFYTKKVKDGQRKSLPSYALFYNGEYADRNLNGFATAVNKSNNATVVNSKAIDTAEIMKSKGKKIGMVFREEEYEKQDGSVGVAIKPLVPHSIEVIKSGDFKIPNRKCVAQSSSSSNSTFGSTSTTTNNDTEEVGDIFGVSTDTELEIPFL